MDNNDNIFNELYNFWSIIKNHYKAIIITTILTTIVVTGAIIFFIKPQYQSATHLIVDQKVSKAIEDSQLQQVQQANVQSVNTYKSIITSPAITNRVRRKLGDSHLVRKSKVDVQTQPNSQVFSISVKSPSPLVASEVSNATAKVFKQRLKHIMKSGRTSIIDKATPNYSPVFPKRSLSVLLGIALGLFLGVIVALSKQYGSQTIPNMDYITDDLHLNDLGVINDINLKLIRKNEHSKLLKTSK